MGILYLVTLLGVDYTEFTQNNEATQALHASQTETKPLIDMSETQKYGIDIDQRGNITVEPDSE